MVKRLVPAIAVVLVVNAWVLIGLARHAAGPRDAVVHLSERELRLRPLDGDRTAITLALEWRDVEGIDGPSWFNASRLEALGFDCSVAPDAPSAPRHYSFRAQPSRPAYVVLEYRPEGPEEVSHAVGVLPADKKAAERSRRGESRLRPIDVGRSPSELRRRFPDRSRYIITLAVVRLELRPSTAPLPVALGGGKVVPAHLRGHVVTVMPQQIYVPNRWHGVLAMFAASSGGSSVYENGPRYEVTLEYGPELVPTVRNVRALR